MNTDMRPDRNHSVNNPVSGIEDPIPGLKARRGKLSSSNAADLGPKTLKKDTSTVGKLQEQHSVKSIETAQIEKQTLWEKIKAFCTRVFLGVTPTQELKIQQWERQDTLREKLSQCKESQRQDVYDKLRINTLVFKLNARLNSLEKASRESPERREFLTSQARELYQNLMNITNNKYGNSLIEKEPGLQKLIHLQIDHYKANIREEEYIPPSNNESRKDLPFTKQTNASVKETILLDSEGRLGKTKFNQLKAIIQDLDPTHAELHPELHVQTRTTVSLKRQLVLAILAKGKLEPKDIARITELAKDDEIKNVLKQEPKSEFSERLRKALSSFAEVPPSNEEIKEARAREKHADQLKGIAERRAKLDALDDDIPPPPPPPLPPKSSRPLKPPIGPPPGREPRISSKNS